MARDKVELLVQLVGKDGVTRILNAAATEAHRLEQNMKKGSRQSKRLEENTKKFGERWSETLTGLNQGLELVSKISQAVEHTHERLRDTVRVRQLEARFVEKISYSMDALQKASGFRLDDAEIKRFALQASEAGIEMAQFEKLLNVALRSSAGTGRDFREVFEGLTDTVIGATDSFLEQLGVVADVGTITDAYAEKLGIAKDKIDKTHQSQAMLNFVLSDVSKRFDSVQTDRFADQLSKAEHAISEFNQEMKKAEMFIYMDIFGFFGGRGGDVANFQAFQDGQKEVERMRAELERFGEGTAKHAQLTAALNAKMRELGEIAKQDETVMLELQNTIRESAAYEIAEMQFSSVEIQAEKLNRGIMRLANSYGVAEIAQKTLTTDAREMQRSLRTTERVAMQTADAFATLNAFMSGKSIGGVDLPKAPERDTETEAKIARFVEKNKPKERRGGGKKREERPKDAEKRYKAVLERYQRTTETQQKVLNTEMTIRETLEALDAEIQLGTAFFGDAEDDARAQEWVKRWQDFTSGEDLKEWAEKNFDWIDPATLRLKELSLAMQGLNTAARTTDDAIAMLGANPGFAAVVKNSGRMAEASINFSKVNKKGAKDYIKLSDTIVDAAGQGALGFIEGEKARAGVLAAMEYAHGSAALAMAIMTQAPNAYVASAMHFVNAGLYTAIASGAKIGKSGGGGGSAGASGSAGAGGARRLPSFGQQQGIGQQMQPAQVVVNMSGAIVAGANRQKTANDLGQLVQESIAGTR